MSNSRWNHSPVIRGLGEVKSAAIPAQQCADAHFAWHDKRRRLLLKDITTECLFQAREYGRSVHTVDARMEYDDWMRRELGLLGYVLEPAFECVTGVMKWRVHMAHDDVKDAPALPKQPAPAVPQPPRQIQSNASAPIEIDGDEQAPQQPQPQRTQEEQDDEDGGDDALDAWGFVDELPIHASAAPPGGPQHIVAMDSDDTRPYASDSL